MDTTLTAALAARAEAEKNHAAAEAALARARASATAAQAEVERLDAADRELVARHAKRLEGRAVAGTAGPPPMAVPTDDVIARRTAEITAAAAAQAVTRLEAAERAAHAQLLSAGSAVKAQERRRHLAVIHELDRLRTAAIERATEFTTMIAVYELDAPGIVPLDVAERLNTRAVLPNIESALQVSRHVVHSIDTPLGTRTNEIEAARAALARFVEAFQRAPAVPSAAERAA